MASRKIEAYQTEPRTYVLFMFELYDECKIDKLLLIKETKFLAAISFGWKL